MVKYDERGTMMKGTWWKGHHLWDQLNLKSTKKEYPVKQCFLLFLSLSVNFGYAFWSFVLIMIDVGSMKLRASATKWRDFDHLTLTQVLACMFLFYSAYLVVDKKYGSFTFSRTYRFDDITIVSFWVSKNWKTTTFRPYRPLRLSVSIKSSSLYNFTNSDIFRIKLLDDFLLFSLVLV